ncbi:hypothetical protein AB4037_18295 [Labrys sp. KB_33_2]|uniref:hypothetical protein n=1 Tax=Labrys sp. KB_33_2 TaxID=3237479 RepID=UPI003F90422D
MKQFVIAVAAGVSVLTFHAPQARAMDCFGGFSCEEIGAAAFSFKVVRDCPAQFQIRPSKRDKFERAMVALRNRPLANVTGNEEFTSTSRQYGAGVCEGAARKFKNGSVEFIELKPQARRK